MSNRFDAIPRINRSNKQISINIPKRKLEIFKRLNIMPKKILLKIESITW